MINLTLEFENLNITVYDVNAQTVSVGIHDLQTGRSETQKEVPIQDVAAAIALGLAGDQEENESAIAGLRKLAEKFVGRFHNELRIIP